MAGLPFLAQVRVDSADASADDAGLLRPSLDPPPKSVVVRVADGDLSLAAHRAARRRSQTSVLIAVVGSLLWSGFLGVFVNHTGSQKPLYFCLAALPFLMAIVYGFYAPRWRARSLRDSLARNRDLELLETACAGPLDEVELAEPNWETSGRPPIQDVGLIGFHDDTTTVQIEGLRFRMLIRQDDVRRFHEVREGGDDDWWQFSLELQIEGEMVDFSLRCRTFGSVRSWLNPEHRDPSHEYILAARDKRLGLHS